MHTGTLKKLALALTFWIALHTSTLRAQLLGPYSNSTGSFEVDANGLLSATGTYGTGSLSLSGTGIRMFWYPGKAAFRAGYAYSTNWNDANIGNYSVALGRGTIASGNASTALGDYSTASGYASTALGDGIASGGFSTALGYQTTASAYYTTASGYRSSASGYGSTAIGFDNDATGYESMALGVYGATASGTRSTALGFETSASSYGSLVLGRYNVGGGSATTWVSTDPLFEIGNGTSTSAKSDALVVYKNGIVAVHNYIRTSPGGDLSMGSFTAGTQP